MDVSSILGMVKGVLDLFGITPYITAFIILALVSAVIVMFFKK